MTQRQELSRAVRWLLTGAATFICVMLSCGGNTGPASPQNSGSAQPPDPTVCQCTPSSSEDVRHAAKHVPLPNDTPELITVATMLGWPQNPIPSADAPRSGRELQLFQIANAYLQLVWLVGSDCDIHVEISDTPDKSAPRAIVETPMDSEYCQAREQLVSSLAAQGITLSPARQELSQPLAATVTGLAFEDLPHSTRGTPQVQTLWELHPATVSIH
jgi:hypothetical protein